MAGADSAAIISGILSTQDIAANLGKLILSAGD